MKKIKLLPSVLMLALCIGILGIGIYAATPTSNVITGTITVNAANAEVDIAAYVDYEKVLDTTSTRAGVTIAIPNSLLEIDMSKYESQEDVNPTLIRIVIRNKSQKALGTYFYKAGTQLGNEAVEENIMLTSTINDSTDSSTVANVKYTSYSYIKANNENDEEDVCEMYMMITPILCEEEKVGNFNISLNIEPYVANITEEEASEGILESESRFVKFPENGHKSENGKAIHTSICVLPSGFGFTMAQELIIGRGINVGNNAAFSSNNDIGCFDALECVVYNAIENITYGVSYEIDFVITNVESVNILEGIDGSFPVYFWENVRNISLGFGEMGSGPDYLFIPKHISSLTFNLFPYITGCNLTLEVEGGTTSVFELPTVLVDNGSSTLNAVWTRVSTNEKVTSTVISEANEIYKCTSTYVNYEN